MPRDLLWAPRSRIAAGERDSRPHLSRPTDMEVEAFNDGILAAIVVGDGGQCTVGLLRGGKSGAETAGVGFSRWNIKPRSPLPARPPRRHDFARHHTDLQPPNSGHTCLIWGALCCSIQPQNYFS